MNIKNIYQEIKDELTMSSLKNQYKTNADGYEHKANNFEEVLKQIFSGSVKSKDCEHLESLIENEVYSYLEIGSYVGVGFRVFNEIFKPRLSVSVDPNIPHRVFPEPRNVFNLLNKKFANSTITIDAFWLENKIPEKTTNTRKFFNEEDFNKNIDIVDANYFNNINLKFDLIFIDGNHSYDSVKIDFSECLKLLSNKGTILIHDVYTWPGVNRFIEELKTDKRFNLKFSERSQSIDGFCAVSKAN